MWVFHKKMLTSAKCSTFLNFFFKKVLIEEYIHAKFQFCSTSCSKVIQIQKVIHTNCLMYIKKPNWESVNVNFKDISFLFLLFLSLTLDR